MDLSNLKFSQNFAIIDKNDDLETLKKKAAAITPTRRQLDWQRMELTAFIHFGMNTFTNQEWGDGSESPSKFLPTDFDARQWVTVLHDAGFKGLILTCKHHDGFCLWPSAYTEHSVKNSPWKNGKGDVVREVSDACREVGMKFGVYLSPWDRHDPRYGDSPAYNSYFISQLTELLTNYGEIYEVWFDGACAEGPNGKKQEYDLHAFYSVIRKLQPNAVISIKGTDVRWVGNEAGKGREDEWSVVPTGILVKGENGQQEAYIIHAADSTQPDLGSDAVLACPEKLRNFLFWYPAQTDTSIRPGWFYHQTQDKKVKTLYELINIYESSVGSNSQLLLNIPPDTRGRIADVDCKRLKEFSDYIKTAYKTNLAQNCHIDQYSKDGKDIVDIFFGHKVELNQLVIMEDITKGQHVSAFEIRLPGEDNKVIAKGKTIGYKKIVKLPEVLTDRIQLVVTDFRAKPVYDFIGAYKVPVVNCPPRIFRSHDGLVSIKADKRAEVEYSVDGGKTYAKYTEPFMFKTSGEVIATARIADGYVFGDREISSHALFGKVKENWKVIYHTGQCDENYSIDWIPRDDRLHVLIYGDYPFEMVIDMGEICDIKGFTYLPVDNHIETVSNFYRYKLYVSKDGQNFTLAHEGAFDNVQNNPVLQIVELSEPRQARFLKLVALSGFETNRIGIGKLSVF